MTLEELRENIRDLLKEHIEQSMATFGMAFGKKNQVLLADLADAKDIGAMLRIGQDLAMDTSCVCSLIARAACPDEDPQTIRHEVMLRCPMNGWH